MGRSEPSLESIRRTVGELVDDPATEYLLAGADGVCQLRYRLSVWTGVEDCWLEDLFVRRDAQRKGLGRALVEAAVERAGERGCKRIELDVNADNDAALALYESAGFSLEPKGPGRTLYIARVLFPP